MTQSSLSSPPSPSLSILLKRVAFSGLAAAALLISPTFRDAARFALEQLLGVAPAILLALLLTAAATASGAIGLIARSFTGRESLMILSASAIGALTPVCGLTVLPLVAGLLAAGAPLAPIMAFWLSSPVTDPGMLSITAATLGPELALGKTLAAFGCGVLGGVVTLALTAAGRLRDPQRPSPLVSTAGRCGCGAPETVLWRFWSAPERRAAFAASALATLRLSLTWLSLAFLAEYFLKLWLPEAWVAGLVGADNGFAVPIAALVGAPIYLDGYAALPLVRGLIEAGMRPDAALAFLVAGGITSAWAAIPVYALVRAPVFALYLALAVLGSMLSGWGYGLLAPI